MERSVRYIEGRWLVGDRKTEAGRRTVSLPGVAAALADHLDRRIPDGDDALVFVTSTGTFLHSANFARRSAGRAGGAAPALRLLARSVMLHP